MKCLIVGLITLAAIAQLALSYKYFGTKRKTSDYLLPFIQYWSKQDSEFQKLSVAMGTYITENEEFFENEEFLHDSLRMDFDMEEILEKKKLDDRLWILAESIKYLVSVDTKRCDMRWLEPALIMANDLFKLDEMVDATNQDEPLMSDTEQISDYKRVYAMFSGKFREMARACVRPAKHNLISFVESSSSIKKIDSVMKKTLTYNLPSKSKSIDEKLYRAAFKHDYLEGKVTDEQRMACKDFTVDSSNSLGMLILAMGFLPNELKNDIESDMTLLKLLEYSRLCYEFNNTRSEFGDVVKTPILIDG